MASDEKSKTAKEPAKPCDDCKEWSKRYTATELKRRALREGVDILKRQIDGLQLDKDNLKKAFDQEQERANVAEQEKEKEVSRRISIEKEIAALKSEISSVKPEVVSGNEHLLKEVLVLQTSIYEKDVEIHRLKKMLAEEERTVAAEGEGIELEKKRAADLQEALEHEKSRADEACKLVDAVRKEAEDNRCELETLRHEVANAKSKCEEANKKLEVEKQKVIKEKKRADEEKARTVEQRKIAEANVKKVKEEKGHANILAAQLEEEKHKVDQLRKEIQDIRSSQSSADNILSRQLDEEKQKVDKLQKEIQDMSSQRSADLLELDEVKRNLEAEKKRAASEKERADTQLSKMEEQKKVTEASVNNALEEKSRAEKLSQDLQSSRQRIDDLEKKLCDLNVMLEAERKQVSREPKPADAEKLKAREKKCGDADISKMLEQKQVTEASVKKAAEEKSRADKLSKDLQDSRQRSDDLEKELSQLKAVLEAERKKVSREQKRADAEKLKSREKKRVDSEMSKFKEQNKVTEASDKKAMEEKSHADKLTEELQNSRKRIDDLQKELCNVKAVLEAEREQKCVDIEKSKASKKKRAYAEMSKMEEQKKLAEASVKKARYEMSHADKLSDEVQKSRKGIDDLEKDLCDVKAMLEAERKKASREQKRANAEKLKAEELEMKSLENDKRAMEEKCRADNLFRELENNRQKLLDLENEVRRLNLSNNLVGASNVPPVAVNQQIAEVNLLRKELKFEKQRAKHFKEVTRLEKGRNSILEQDQHRLRKDFNSLLHHLDSLTDTFRARHGLEKKSSLAKTGQLSRRMLCSSPPDMYLCGDPEPRRSSLSSWDASFPLTENKGFGKAGQCMDSPSGMETELDIPLGGSRGKTLPSSVLNSNTASFSDEQLMGSQERIDGSLTTSVVLAAENTNLQPTIVKQSSRRCKRIDGEKVGNVAEDTLNSPVEIEAGHVKKRRMILKEFESIKCMQSEGRRVFEEAEKKLSVLHDTLVQPIIDQLETEKLPMSVSKVNHCDNNYDGRGEKRKASHGQAVLPQLEDSTVHTAPDKLESLALTSIKRAENLGASRNQIERNQDDLISFEQMMNGDYMKLLDLDNAAEEEMYRAAVNEPLSPTLPEIDLCDGEIQMDAQILTSNGVRDQHGCSTKDKDQLCCIVFSEMEDVSSITRIFCAMRTCLGRCCLFLKKNWMVQDILAALVLEKDLRPREKVCVFFSLVAHNICLVSSGKAENFHNQEWLDSFSAHMSSVISNVETRNLFAEICDFRDLLSLSEDFILRSRIFLWSNMTSSPSGSSSNFEILHDGERYALSPSRASTNLVMAGSILLASICRAVGQIGSVCEVSFNLLCVPGSDYSLVLVVFHIFACICGEEYFTTSDYCLIMKVVRSMVTFIEGALAGSTEMDLQPGNSCLPQFSSFTSCPFKAGSVSLEDVTSMLLEELENCCVGHNVPQDPAELARSSNTTSPSYIWDDLFLSLELIASKKGWDWACSKIVPSVFKMMESCDGGSTLSTALVAFVCELGRLGVEACGYDDVRVESIRCQFSNIFSRVVTSKSNTPHPMAVVSALVGLYPKGNEEVVRSIVELLSKSGHSAFAASDIMKNCLSSL